MLKLRDRTTFLIIISFFIPAVLLSTASCTTFAEGPETAALPEMSPPETAAEIQLRLLESAEYYRGLNGNSISAGTKTWQLDCSGAMLAVYYRAGINLEKCYTGYLGNGVRRLYSCLRDNKLIFNTKIPAVGDLIFWDNTWDRDGDGSFNDYFTHTGMVVAVDEDGTITYLHDNYRKGLVYETMNMFHPKDPALNSPMRMAGSPPAPEGQSLASELVRVFGRAWLLPGKFFRR